MYSTNKVPFHTDIDEFGIRVAHGWLILGDNMLIIEFQKEDGFVGMIKSDIERIEVPFKIIESIDFEKSFFSAKVIIEPKSMKDFDGIDIVKRGRLKLNIKRKYRKLAESTLSTAMYQLSEFKLGLLENE